MHSFWVNLTPGAVPRVVNQIQKTELAFTAPVDVSIPVLTNNTVDLVYLVFHVSNYKDLPD